MGCTPFHFPSLWQAQGHIPPCTTRPVLQRSKGHSPVPGQWGNYEGSLQALWQSRPCSRGTSGSTLPQLRGGQQETGQPISPVLSSRARTEGWGQQLWMRSQAFQLAAHSDPTLPWGLHSCGRLTKTQAPSAGRPRPGQPQWGKSQARTPAIPAAAGKGRQIWAVEEVKWAGRHSTAGPAPPRSRVQVLFPCSCSKRTMASWEREPMPSRLLCTQRW